MAAFDMPGARAAARHIRIAPQKVRVVADQIRGRSVDEALAMLNFIPKAAAPVIAKVVKSAAANAENNFDMARGQLFVSEVFVDQGPTLKRGHPRYRGQIYPILKRSSHVTVVVREREG